MYVIYKTTFLAESNVLKRSFWVLDPSDEYQWLLY